MCRTVAEYAGKLTTVISVIDSYLEHHTHVTTSGTILMHVEVPATEEGISEDASNIHQAISNQSNRRSF